MPRPISRVGESRIEIDNDEAVGRGYLSTNMEDGFSAVRDPNNPDEGKRNMPPPRRRGGGGPDEAIPITVEAEDEGVLRSRLPDATPKEIERMLQGVARTLSEKEARAARLEAEMRGMGDAERDAYLRFRNLDLDLDEGNPGEAGEET